MNATSTNRLLPNATRIGILGRFALASSVCMGLGLTHTGCANSETADAGDTPGCQGAKCDALDGGGDEEGFEFIIIGSGAGGGPLAANLARNNHRVLLLEAGEDPGDNVNYQVPAYHGRSTEDPAMRWDFFVKHYDDAVQAQRDSKYVVDPTPHQESGILYPRAGTLGGCTAHHAMIMVYCEGLSCNKGPLGILLEGVN